MSFNWTENIKLAEQLADFDENKMTSESETYYRSSVGRSYYACHKTIHDWLTENTQYITPRNSVHEDIIKRLPIFIDSPTVSEIQRHLDTLKFDRVAADYKITSNIIWSKQKAKDCVSLANKIIELLGRSRPKP